MRWRTWRFFHELFSSNPLENFPRTVTLTRDEFQARSNHANMPEKFDATGGELFWSDEQYLPIPALFLEAVGLRRALALCPSEAIRTALAQS